MKKNFSIIPVILLSVGCASQRIHTYQTTERIHFNFNKSDVHESDKERLGWVARIMKKDTRAIVIVEGHTDRIGSHRYNEILAEKRARAVRAYLGTLGADPARMTMLSKGKREPLTNEISKSADAMNRRVEIIMTSTTKPKAREP
jgi:outer membrane protein OmpA-like peptidoglycan-associated protein